MSGEKPIYLCFTPDLMLVFNESPPFMEELRSEDEISWRIRSNGSLPRKWQGEGAWELLLQIIPDNPEDKGIADVQSTTKWKILQECINNTKPATYVHYKLALEKLRKILGEVDVRAKDAPVDLCKPK